MEGVPTQTTESNIDSKPEERLDFDNLIVEAPVEADRRIAEIEGFEEMELMEKIVALKELRGSILEESLEPGGNNLRYIYKEVNKRLQNLIDEASSVSYATTKMAA